MKKPIRFGVQTAPQNCAWDDLVKAWQAISASGFETAWTFDHFFPILSDPKGPCFEGWTALTALAVLTPRVKLGVLVTGNTYRNPALLASIGRTLDHISNGRLIMGLGAGWFEQEHLAYSIPFYTTAERIRRLEEAVQIIKRLWTEPQVTFEGKYYQIKDAYSEPKPIQKPHPPIMIGGAGEKMTLRVVAKYADQWNTFGSPEVFRHKIGLLKGYCEEVGRDMSEIEISWAGATKITDSAAEKTAIVERFAKAFGTTPEQAGAGLLVGPLEEIRDRIGRLSEEGISHFIFMPTPPLNSDAIEQLGEQVANHFRTPDSAGA